MSKDVMYKKDDERRVDTLSRQSGLGKELKVLVEKMEQTAERRIAVLTMKALRHCRDVSPDAWADLLKSDSGPVMLALWDYFRSIEKSKP